MGGLSKEWILVARHVQDPPRILCKWRRAKIFQRFPTLRIPLSFIERVALQDAMMLGMVDLRTVCQPKTISRSMEGSAVFKLHQIERHQVYNPNTSFLMTVV
jgi:hypothetical protein